MTQDEKLQLVRGWAICGVGFSANGSGLNGPGFGEPAGDRSQRRQFSGRRAHAA
jgi:hypothetical protein